MNENQQDNSSEKAIIQEEIKDKALSNNKSSNLKIQNIKK